MKYSYKPYGHSIRSVRTAGRWEYASVFFQGDPQEFGAVLLWLSVLQSEFAKVAKGEAGGINLYGYVSNDPVNRIDPWGWSDFNAPPGGLNGPKPPGQTIKPISPFQPINPGTRDALSKFFKDPNPDHLKDVPSEELQKARDNAKRACDRYENQNRRDKFWDLQRNRQNQLDDVLRRRMTPPPVPWWMYLDVPLIFLPPPQLLVPNFPVEA